MAKKTFTTRPFLKFLLLVTFLAGFFLLAFVLREMVVNESQKGNENIMLIAITVVFFFFLPFMTFKYVKVIEVENGNWKVRYPFQRKTISIEKDKVEKIELIYDTHSGNVGRFSQINIRLKKHSSIYINSLEINNFKQLANAMEKDFKGLWQQKGFWTGK